ncbi:adenylate cyclase [Lichtheimia corymbifera JMRC:FSU:9682]|uniref:Adenylate cyclase n=1 Tax=Lichtheimia corymbifera JMRC:FSU:9682 TaxID=1263082 RepID=A0A068RHM6_9FUNG|nr:adenylate cyclase [Lichtheimia corymbifera JMRC:FSU:9682]
MSSHNAPTNGRANQHKKRNPIPYPRGGRHIGDSFFMHSHAQPTTANAAAPTTGIHPLAAIHHKRSGSAEYDNGAPSLHYPTATDASQMSGYSNAKDKKKTLFRFGKKKAPPNASSSSALQSNASSVSLSGHPYKQGTEYESRHPHPLDALGIDDPGRRSPYGTQTVRKKSSGSYTSRKGKDRERSDGGSSIIQSNSGSRGKNNFDLYIDQDFASMEGIVNPAYQAMQHPYQKNMYPLPQNQDPNEHWEAPDSWGVQQPGAAPSQEPHLFDNEATEYDDYSAMEPRNYDVQRKNYCIRIFRTDGTFTTLQLPLDITTADIIQRLAAKFFMHDQSKLCLTLKRHNLERVLQLSERPLQIQKTLFEYMGYSEQDNIADVGREDNSYLLRFIFGPNVPHTIPEDVDYSEQQHIDLQARNLPAIPISLYKYASRIVSLDLSKNLQMDIPVDFIHNCRHLKQLWLANNDYVTIPQSIRYVRDLEHLNISGNRLRDLQHARLEEITGLKTLRVYNNCLSQIPRSFGTFKQLSMLFMSNNDFTTFPEAICDIVSLQFLDISFNKVQEFPDEIGNLVNLTRLFAIANRLSGSLPQSFAKLEKLQELDIRQNHINDFDVLCGLPKLEILFADYNAVSIVACRFKSLRQLKMTKNQLTQFNIIGDTARRPSMDHTLTPTLSQPISTDQQCTMLTDLNISSCMLSSLPEDLFYGMPNVEKLILDNNTLSFIPSSIGALRKLVELSVQDNILDSLPAEISKLSELKVLDAQKNNLKFLPPEIWLCPSLHELNCSSNLLETFPKPFTASGVALHLPMASQGDVPNAALENVLPKPLGGHAGQGVVPGRGGSGGGGSKDNSSSSSGGVTRGDTSIMQQENAGPAAGMQSSPNFNPPSFFASPHNHPPPLSLSLRKLFLGDNRLGNEIWAPLMMFLELRTLNLSFNDLDEIPPEHLCHQHLYELYLSGNHLTSLPADDIEKLSYLRVLAVNGNKLQTLPAEIGKLRKLLVLDVGSNVLKYNIANWPYDWNWNWNLSLKFLNLSGNKRLAIKKTHPELHGPKEKDLADFGALTRLRMLGLMDLTILGVVTPEETQDRRVRTSLSEVNNMAYGVADWLGSNEHLSTWDLVMPRFRNSDDECVFGLFDGRKSSRTGCKLTKYLNDQLTTHLETELRKLKNDDTVVSAMRRAFLSLEKGLGTELMDEKDAGASAVVCYVAGTKLYVANVGDAMAVISRNNGQAFEITHKHISLNPSEISRIRAAGGYVSHTGKLNNELKVSRGFGYFDLIPVVNANPYVATIELTENDEFVIMASPGLWERMSYQTAVDVARTEKDDLMAAAQKLRDFAITYGAERDLMVMVIGVGDLFDKRDKRGRIMRGLGRGGTGVDTAGILLDDVPLAPTGMLTGKLKRRGKEEGPGDSTLARLDREVPPPINQVALVFTDIKSSTLLWETQPENMRSAIKIHDAVMRRTLRSVGGYEVKTEGDAFMVCFQNITAALLWCFTVQLQLLEADWPAGILSSEECREIEKDSVTIYRGLSVRMGIHWGTPVFERNPITSRMDYFGPVVNKASRICNAADGGQICVSSDVVAALRNFPGVLDDDTLGLDDKAMSTGNYLINRDIQQLKRLGFRVMELGMRRLKGLETPEMLSFVYPKQLEGRMERDQLQEPPAVPSPASVPVINSPSPSPHLNPEPRSVSPHTDIQERSSSDMGQPGLNKKGSNAIRVIDPMLVHSLCTLALRLENLTTEQLFGQPSTKQLVKANPMSKAATGKIQRLLERHIMNDATDEELVTLMENFVARLENAVSALYLQKVGHFANVLEKLGEAIDLDSMHILRALQMYSEVARLTETPAGLASFR